MVTIWVVRERQGGVSQHKRGRSAGDTTKQRSRRKTRGDTHRQAGAYSQDDRGACYPRLLHRHRDAQAAQRCGVGCGGESVSVTHRVPPPSVAARTRDTVHQGQQRQGAERDREGDEAEERLHQQGEGGRR